MWNRAGPPPPWPPRQPVPYGLPINLPANPATWSPQMLVNVPSSTIDWALLARQWIAHRDSQPRHHQIPERLRAPIIHQPRSMDPRPPNFNAINSANKARPIMDIPKRPPFQPSVELEPLKPLLQTESVAEQPYGFLDDSGIGDQIDPCRRKQLPSWIREELEKMEKEKAKQAEKEKREQEYSDGNVSDMEQSPQAVEKQPLSFETILEEMDEEQREAIRLNFTRNALTEILLDVTNQLIASQASKCFEKAKLKAPAKQIAKSSALASITSLGLGYDSDSEKSDKRSGTSDDSTDEEQLFDRSDALLRKFKQKMLDPKKDNNVGGENRKTRGQQDLDLVAEMVVERVAKTENQESEGVGPLVVIVIDVPVVVTESQEDVDRGLDQDRKQEKLKLLISPQKRKGREISIRPIRNVDD
ncbi:DgyrCDS9834 [Dimorphilus gyrociliatus]|uniref:DgyrCDS9834 n=1 Tax=Dimorphilus gyrociliatus TaxID=2664684 RepID=A0A7I8VYI7_9ANNE|nr:DgyrCDS9834 [Dimorphilus gyrociliatus]